MKVFRTKTKKQHRLYSLVVFVITVMCSVFLLINLNAKWQESRQKNVENMLRTHATSIEKSINTALATAKVAGAWVVAQEGYVDNFNGFAKNIINNVAGITNLQLAPKGVVKYIYPLQGHEAAIGHDILKDDKRKTEAQLAILSNKLTLAGPFELKQGGVAIIGRQPIFLEHNMDQQMESDDTKRLFWGFASVLIRMETLFAETTLQRLSAQGNYFQLWRNHPDSGEKEIFYSNKQNAIAETLQLSIELPNAIWYLNIEQAQANSFDWEIFLSAAIFILFDLWLSFYFYSFLRGEAPRDVIFEQK